MLGFEISHIVITTVVLCLFMWRMSYGANNGLFAEATGLISVFAAVAAVYYLIKIAGAVISERFGDIIPKIGYLVVAFLIYKVMSTLADQLRKVKDIPILGGLDRLLGAVLGMIEAIVIIRFITFITEIEILPVFMATMTQIVELVKSKMQ